MSKPESLLASVALTLAVLGSPALAADGKTMPGSACHPLGDSLPRQLYRESSYLVKHGIFNRGNAREFVSCPVVKDLSKISGAVVRVTDPNPDPNADIICSLSTLRSDGTSQADQVLKSNGSSADTMSLSFAAQAAANGSYYLRCSLPPFRQGLGASGIVNYTVVEE